MNTAMIRPARRSDAASLAILIDIAGYGLPSRFWSLAPERGPHESVFAFGRKRAQREEGAFSYRNARVAEVDGEVIGMLLGYGLPDRREPVPDDMPELARPLLELEAEAPGTWYVNVLAVFEEFRGRGIGGRLLAEADGLAESAKARGLSIIVESDNRDAIGLYRKSGYRDVATRPFVPFPGSPPAENWVLMIKPRAAV